MSHALPLRSVLLAVAGLLASSIAADARPPSGPEGDSRGRRGGGDPTRILERLDANGDGAITPDEVPDGPRGDRLRARLERLDTDGDGRLTRAELEAARERARQRLDRDGDGVISEDERARARRGGRQDRQGATKRAARLDADGDGRVTLQEFLDGDDPFARWDDDGDGVITRPQVEADDPRAEQLLRRFDTLDVDHDGRLTRAEAAESRKRRFERLDDDGDGELSSEELERTRRRSRERRQR